MYFLNDRTTGAHSITAEADEIRQLSENGLKVFYGMKAPFIPCRIAWNSRGWITAGTESGAIIQAWAGEFCGAIEGGV